MSIGDVVVFWILALPVAAAFYLAYGVVEEIIRKRRPSSRITDVAQLLNHRARTTYHLRCADMIRLSCSGRMPCSTFNILRAKRPSMSGTSKPFSLK
jgi:hypothetical protein